MTWSIPACAGEPAGRIMPVSGRLRAGLSPRVRGNLDVYLHSTSRCMPVYPRVCGGTSTMIGQLVQPE